MAATANVQSVAALKEFRTALCLFAEAARSSLGEADADLQRHTGWLVDDRARYWQSEIGRRNEMHQQAKLVLLRKKMATNAAGGRQSCVDEEKVVVQTRRQLEEAQQKAESAKRWVRRLEELVFIHKSALQQLSYALDNDVVNMLALLDRMVESLNKYFALAAPAAMEPESAESEAPSMARPAAEPMSEVVQNLQQQGDKDTQAGQATNPSENDNAAKQEPPA